jgi:hypothetical protein
MPQALGHFSVRVGWVFEILFAVCALCSTPARITNHLWWYIKQLIWEMVQFHENSNTMKGVYPSAIPWSRFPKCQPFIPKQPSGWSRWSDVITTEKVAATITALDSLQRSYWLSRPRRCLWISMKDLMETYTSTIMHQTQSYRYLIGFSYAKSAGRRHRQCFLVDKSCTKMCTIFSPAFRQQRKSAVVTSFGCPLAATSIREQVFHCRETINLESSTSKNLSKFEH